jgi:CheY-like chemotaxis protein
MDGFEIARMLRAHPEEHSRTVLVLRPDYIVEEMARVREAGLRAYVVKPLSRPNIEGAISAALGIDAGAATSDASPDPKPKRTRILLAEDTADVAWIIRTQLEGPEYQVDVARDGAVALNLFRLEQYDLVLMDIHMPNFDGYWATREIRAWERLKKLRHTPIIAITAFAQSEDPQKSMRAGLDGYLVKPVSSEKLRSVIGKYLKRK